MSNPRLIALLLALITLVVYLPVTRNDFINYDDGDYVFENPHVQSGLTRANVQWAFTTFHAGNWHPVTWLSHMTDCELFGLNPGAQHLVNVLFHAANAVLLFTLLLRLTEALWPSALAAGLFAWHPLHVESVAWISERKDVLSVFFAMLTLLAYKRFVEESKAQSPKSKAFYALALLMFALGLMSKPMLVTLPFVLLLLGFWPLQRLNTSTLRRLLIEKIPFFLLTTISCVVTFLAQSRGAVRSLEEMPLLFRLENAPVSVTRYLLKICWPTRLAVIYPPVYFPGIIITVSVAILIFISAAVWLARKRHPVLLFGWLWFLGTLVPVMGLVKVGDAAMADRYTYMPSIGIFIAVAFGGGQLAKQFQFPKMALGALAILIFAACLALTTKQLSYWRDTESLFRHALDVTTGNADAHINYGVALEKKGLLAKALDHYREAERIAPESVQAHNNIGNILDDMGEPLDAAAEYRDALRIKPNLPAMHDSLGNVLVKLGHFDEAMIEFTNAARLDPHYPWPYFEMAKALLKEGRDTEAIQKFREALRLDPENAQILAYAARVLAADENPQIRDGQAAFPLADKANALTGGAQPFALDALGMACAELGRFDDAQQCVQKAIDIANAAKMKDVEELQQRLQLYKNHRPWRESFLAANAPVKN